MPRTFALAAAVLIALSAAAGAQEITTGSIGGRVLDEQGLPAPGASVIITSAQGTRTFTTDADGRFFAPFLTPGRYQVRIELQGFRSMEYRAVDVRLGQRVDLTPRLQVGTLAEVVEVTGSTPVINTATTTAGTVLDADLLSRIPVERRIYDTLYVAPGVSSGGGTGRANPSIGGASGLENQYVIDGVNITNPGYGALGSYSIVHGTLGSGVNFDFVKEIQVKTAGYEAEYGQSTGGVVNVVTRSGSNVLNGSAYGFFRPSALEADWRQTELTNWVNVNAAVNTTRTATEDAGAQVGGPAVRDRVFFFGAVNPQWEQRTFIAPEGFPLRDLGGVERDRWIVSYSGKGTFQLNGGHRLDASFFGDPATGSAGPQRDAALLRAENTGLSSLDYGGHNQTVKYDGIVSARWLVEASYGRAQQKFEETLVSDLHSVIDLTVTPNLRFGGIGFYENSRGVNHQLQAKSTHLWAGHQIRYGFLYEDIQYDSSFNRSGPTFVLHDGTRTATGASLQIRPDAALPGGVFYRVSRANITTVRETEQQYLNFFVQDTWRVTDRLTVRPGIRYEQQKLVGNLADFRWDNNWGPRIGGTYDVWGGGRSKIYAAWGRFYARIPNDLAARALSADAGVTRADYYDAALTQPIPEGVLAGGTTTHFLQAGLFASDFDPESRSTYLDETLVGYEHEALPGLSLGIRYIYRNMPRVLEDVGLAPMVAYFEKPSSELASVEYFITNPTEATPVMFPEYGARFERPIHRYDAVEVTADKRFSNRWLLQSSYRWSRLHGTFEGFFRNDNGQSDPAITSLYDFPTDDPSYTAIGVPLHGFRGDIRFLGAAGAGPLPNDRPHQVKVFSYYAWDNGLAVGSGVIVGSGAPLTALAANPDYTNGGEIPETPRGEGFQTVDGFRRRTPAEIDVNLQASYGFRLAGHRLVVLGNVFNLFNTRRVRADDDWTESTFGTPNDDFGRVIRYQPPLQVQFGARFEF